MRIVVTRDIVDFARRAEVFLAEGIERNVMASVLVALRGGSSFGASRPLFAYGLDGNDRLVAAAMRTPPWPMLATGFARGEDAAELVRSWLGEDPAVEGVSAETETARAVAEAWAAQTGGATSRRMHEAMHVLSVVEEPPRRAPGSLRLARLDERIVLIEWERAFVTETRVGVARQAPQAVDRRLATETQYVWDDGGPVCTVACAPLIAGTARIGPVFTPREQRCHGYATSAVAALSARLLAGGALQCMLFTDLSNPTSNKIYASIGFKRRGGWEEHVFIAPAAAGG